MAVRIEQPPANKIMTFSLGGLAVFLTLVFSSKVSASGFTILAMIGVALVLIYVFRAVRVSAVADRSSFELHNVVKSARLSWNEIEDLTVAPTNKGRVTGISLVLVDGSTIPVEASWGPWYRGGNDEANIARCEQILIDIAAMRSEEPTVRTPIEVVDVDALTSRGAVAEDADAIAEMIDTAWHETYVDILAGYSAFHRDPADDARMLTGMLENPVDRRASKFPNRRALPR